MKHRLTRFFWIFAIFATIFTVSCTVDNSIDTEEIENEIFAEWMAKYHPELLENYQEDGAYYIDLITEGDTSSRPISDTTCWVQYDLTGYDLNGNICVTRNDLVAWQQGSYTDYTHYTPYYRLSYVLDEDEDEDDYDFLLECTQLAFTKELTIGDRTDVLLYNGAEFTLFSPSSILSTEGVTGTGGYEGQYTLGTMPFICRIKVTNVIEDAQIYENELVNAFAISNGGLTVTSDSFNLDYDDDDDDDDDDEDEDEDEDEEDEEDEDDDDPNSWTNATSNVPYLYINKNYTPSYAGGTSFNYVNPYTSVVPDSPYYNGIAELDRKINIALAKYFSDDYYTSGEKVDDDGSATIWYICRLLDGFIVDTNIDVVKELIYGSVDSSGSAISYSMDSDEENYISAWYYSIPEMTDGRWCAIVTSSVYAYGSSGVNGDSATTSTTYYSSAYSNYYSYYSGYSSYYSDSSYGYSDYSSYYDDSTTTTSSTSTEILPYSPLIFEMYVVALGDDD
ncbi:MAG: hypothetical protein SNG38_06620 [Rikenellaceae bacterium]